VVGEEHRDAANWARAATHSAAGELARRLNEAAVINPVNLLALALLATPRHTADEQALYRLLDHYQALANEAPYAAATLPCPLDARQIVAYAERLGIAERVAHPLGDLIRIPMGEAPLLAYFRNNVLPLFVLPALVACLLNHNRYLGAQRVSEALAGIYGLLSSGLFLRCSAAELPAATATVIDVFVKRGLLRRNDAGRLAAPEANSQEFAELRMLGETVRPILERQFLTLALLQHVGSGTRTRRTLENDCHLLAQRLTLLYDFNTPEYSEKTTFSGLIANLIDADLLREDETGLLHFDKHLTTPLAQASLVLPAEARQAIQRMACAGLVN
jgi:glycerol-3-phosphate O-acyltransferase